MKKLKFLSMLLLIFSMYNVQNCSSNSQDLTCWVEPTKFACSMGAIVAMNCMQSMVAPQTTIGVSSIAECTAIEQVPSRLKPMQKFTQWYRNLLKIRPLESVSQDATVCYDDKVIDPSDIFRMGDVAFYDKEVPQGMTREQVYKIMIAKQENYLKAEILRQLDVTPEEFEGYAKLASDHNQEYFETIKRKQTEEGRCTVTPIEPLLLQHVAKEFGPEEAQALCHVSVAHCDVDVTSDTTNADALQDHITLYHQSMKNHYGKNIELYPVREQQISYHELSHIRHQDVSFGIAYNLLMRAIKLGQGTVSMQDGEPAAVICYNGLKKETVTKERLTRAIKLFNQWKKLHEYRADLESAFVLKETEEFKKVHTKDVLYDEGYPSQHSYAGGYQNVAAVNFLEDFHSGVVRDNVCAKSEVKKTCWMEWLGLK